MVVVMMIMTTVMVVVTTTTITMTTTIMTGLGRQVPDLPAEARLPDGDGPAGPLLPATAVQRHGHPLPQPRRAPTPFPNGSYPNPDLLPSKRPGLVPDMVPSPVPTGIPGILTGTLPTPTGRSHRHGYTQAGTRVLT